MHSTTREGVVPTEKAAVRYLNSEDSVDDRLYLFTAKIGGCLLSER